MLLSVPGIQLRRAGARGAHVRGQEGRYGAERRPYLVPKSVAQHRPCCCHVPAPHAQVAAAVAEYVRIAREAGLTPAQLGYAWCRWVGVVHRWEGAVAGNQSRVDHRAVKGLAGPGTLPCLRHVS